MPLGREVGLGPSDTVRWGPSSLLPKKGAKPPPNFQPMSVMAKRLAMDQDGTWHGGRPQSRPHCARWGRSSPSPKKGARPQFLALVYCGQTVGWIKMPLGTMVGLGPGNIVLDADPAPLQGAQLPQILSHVCCGQNGWMDQNATWCEGRPRPRPHCVTWGPSSPLPKGAQPPIFGPCLLWPNGLP